MATLTDIAAEAEDVSKTILAETPKWRHKFSRPLLIRSRVTIESMAGQLTKQLREITRLTERNRADVKKARQEAETIENRIILAMDELEKSKGNFKPELPFAILLSPWQFERLTWRLGLRGRKNSKPSQYMGFPIYTAKGVYGPIVLTEDAFNGLSRQAPELMLKAV